MQRGGRMHVHFSEQKSGEAGRGGAPARDAFAKETRRDMPSPDAPAGESARGLPRVSACDRMTGDEFEQFCAALLRANGFRRVSLTSASGDFGVDVLAEKNGASYAVQCKCYASPVGNRAVQEAYSGAAYYERDIAVVMANQDFTRAAQQTAGRLGVELWGRGELARMRRSCAPLPARAATAAARALFGRPAAVLATLLTACLPFLPFAKAAAACAGRPAALGGAAVCWLGLFCLFVLLGKRRR